MTTELVLTEESVRDALKQVDDPELGINIVDLGLVYEIAIEGTEVNVLMTLTTPFCPVGPPHNTVLPGRSADQGAD
jgi:metal-sulfur cluster biosynthetic enzyme